MFYEVRKLQKKCEEEACSKYMSGETISDIAKYFGTTRGYIYSVLDKNNVERKRQRITRRKKTEQRRQQIYELYNAGETVKSICNKLRLSDTTIYNYLNLKERKNANKHYNL